MKKTNKTKKKTKAIKKTNKTEKPSTEPEKIVGVRVMHEGAKAPKGLIKFKFSENNSGGNWWLKRADYKMLFASGWYYEISKYDSKNNYDENTFSGESAKDAKGSADDAPYGWRHNLIGFFASMKEAVDSFEAATGQNFFAEGCGCCGAPFSMRSEPEDGKTTEYLSGDSVEREVIRPW